MIKEQKVYILTVLSRFDPLLLATKGSVTEVALDLRSMTGANTGKPSFVLLFAARDKTLPVIEPVFEAPEIDVFGT